MYDTILIPTDGSDHSVRAAEHGLYLAETFDTSVHVINVIDVPEASEVFGAGDPPEDVVTRLEEEGKGTIEAIEGVLDDRDSVTTAVLRGEPSEAILEYANDHGADAIAMGTHGRTGVQRYVAGSVTERVVRLSEMPVLTVRATASSPRPGGYDEVLVPTDGSDPATAAVDHGLAIAERAGARVHAVNIVDVGDAAFSPNYARPMVLIDHLESEGETATERIATRARDRGLDAVTEVHEGFPAEALLEYADENGIDLITMATAGRTGLDRFLLGSTTERIIRHADAPVFAVNAGDPGGE